MVALYGARHIHGPLVVEEGGLLYDSDAYNDELPYWTYDYGRRI